VIFLYNLLDLKRIRVIGDELAPEDSDSTLIIRRVPVKPKTVACDVKPAVSEVNSSQNQSNAKPDL
jgi:hypothetical protein